MICLWSLGNFLSKAARNSFNRDKKFFASLAASNSLHPAAWRPGYSQSNQNKLCISAMITKKPSKNLLLSPISTPSVEYLEIKSKFQSMNFFLVSFLAAMLENLIDPVQPPTESITLLPAACVRFTSLGSPDSTAQSSVKAGTRSALFKIAKAIYNKPIRLDSELDR